MTIGEAVATLAGTGQLVLDVEDRAHGLLPKPLPDIPFVDRCCFRQLGRSHRSLARERLI